ncbi:MAG: hypothetical protein RIK87_06460 [Fuerstiella sp.]
MKKEFFHDWLRRRVEGRWKITVSAAAAMAALGLLAFVVQAGILYLLLSVAYGSRSMAAIVVLLLFGGMGIVTCLTAPRQLRDSEHEIQVGFRTVTVRLAPTLASAWTYAMGSLESDQSIPMRIVSIMMLVPRLLWTSWHVFGRINRVRDIDVESTGKVLRMVLRKSERVEAEEIAEKYPDIDLPKTLRQLSFIDGVVFLTKDSVGISLANRFKDDLEKSLAEVRPDIVSDPTPFDT